MHSIPTQGCYLARWTGVVYQPSASSWPAIAHLAGKDPSRGSLLLPFPLSIHPGEQCHGSTLCAEHWVRSRGVYTVDLPPRGVCLPCGHKTHTKKWY